MIRTLLLLTVLASSALAEVRLYITPVAPYTDHLGRPRIGPKYYPDIIRPAGVQYGWVRMGDRPVCLMAADVTPQVHSALVANTDVWVFPAGFETNGQTVGSNVTAVTNMLESYGIPAQWLTNQMTYLDMAHIVGSMFQFMQRLTYYLPGADPFAGVPLNTQLRQLPQNVQNAITLAGTSFGWDMSVISPNTTLRNFLKIMADQWGATPLPLGIIVIRHTRPR